MMTLPTVNRGFTQSMVVVVFSGGSVLHPYLVIFPLCKWNVKIDEGIIVVRMIQ